MPTRRTYDLKERLIEYSALIAQIVQGLPRSRIGNYFGGQLCRSGFSPALNYAEAESAESRQDFVHRIKVVLKELRESLMSLRIILRLKLLKSESLLVRALDEANQLIAIFVKSIETARRNELSDEEP